MMRALLSLLWRICAATILGTLISLYILQYDPRVKKKIEYQLQDLFGRFFDCSVQGNVEALRIFTLTPSITATRVNVSPRCGHEWQWSCERFTLSLSWAEILWGKKIGVKSDIYRLQASSACHGQHVCIMDHVNNLMKSGADFPFEFRALRINKGSCELHNQQKGIIANVCFDADVSNLNKRLQALWYLDGNVSMHDKTMFDGSSIRISYDKDDGASTARVSASTNLSFFDPSLAWSLKGAWKQSEGSCCVQDNHGFTLIDTCTVTISPDGTAGSAHVAIPYAYLQRYVTSLLSPCPHPVLDVESMYAHGLLSGTMRSQDERLGCPQGTFEYDVVKQQGSLTVKGLWEALQYTLALQYANAQLEAVGTLDHEKNFATIQCNEHGTFKGTITSDCLQFLMHALLNTDMQGAASCDIQGHVQGKKIEADVVLAEGTIRLATLYNFIQTCTGTVLGDIGKKAFSLKHWNIGLHRGTLAIPYARCMYDHNNELYWYMPVHFNDLFLAVERDIFAIVSGRLLFVKKPGSKARLEGTLCIDRAQVRHNIFSMNDQKQVTQALSQTLAGMHDIDLALNVETRRPIHVKTPVLESELEIRLALAGSMQAPQLSGAMKLVEGTLHFPYKSLAVTHGTLYSMPYNNSDLALELHAKGRVKQYMIHMYGAGSLRDPHITFSSTPSLSQEQIVMLLLGGSEQGALGVAVPSSVMQVMHDVMFGARRSRDIFDKSVLSPLRYIRLVPSFTDQAGRGGFRGAIEIEVTDQLRAVIQKNFSLSEDTRFEVEYQVSDEITVRGLRDERSDIGGEVEMRFVF